MSSLVCLSAEGSKNVTGVINHAQGYSRTGWDVQSDAGNAKHINCVGADDSIIAIDAYAMVANGDTVYIVYLLYYVLLC